MDLRNRHRTAPEVSWQPRMQDTSQQAGAPQSPQNRRPVSFSPPQLAQITGGSSQLTSWVEAYDFASCRAIVACRGSLSRQAADTAAPEYGRIR